MLDNTSTIILAEGDISICVVEESSLHIKCITKYGDPVELNFEEVKRLYEVLLALSKRIE